jgi:aspartate/tyrosine/aromatic aminotransferase
MQKTLEKIYSPSQDQIIEGLSQFNDEQTNMIAGHDQHIEMTNLLQKDQASSGQGAVNAGLNVQEKYLTD